MSTIPRLAFSFGKRRLPALEGKCIAKPQEKHLDKTILADITWTKITFVKADKVYPDHIYLYYFITS